MRLIRPLATPTKTHNTTKIHRVPSPTEHTFPPLTLLRTKLDGASRITCPSTYMDLGNSAPHAPLSPCHQAPASWTTTSPARVVPPKRISQADQADVPNYRCQWLRWRKSMMHCATCVSRPRCLGLGYQGSGGIAVDDIAGG